jgi:phytoene dehydrogenase-like protein
MSSIVLFLDADEYPKEVQKTNYYEFDMNRASRSETDYTAYMAVEPDAETIGKRSFAVIKPIPINEFELFFGKNDYNKSEKYTTLKNQWTENILGQVVERFPILKKSVNVLDTSTPVTYNRYTKSVNGCMYGVKHEIAQRQLGTRSSISNLYLAGQSIQLGVMGSVISGFMAALNIVDGNVLEKDIRLCH